MSYRGGRAYLYDIVETDYSTYPRWNGIRKENDGLFFTLASGESVVGGISVPWLSDQSATIAAAYYYLRVRGHGSIAVRRSAGPVRDWDVYYPQPDYNFTIPSDQEFESYTSVAVNSDDWISVWIEQTDDFRAFHDTAYDIGLPLLELTAVGGNIDFEFIGYQEESTEGWYSPGPVQWSDWQAGLPKSISVPATRIATITRNNQMREDGWLPFSQSKIQALADAARDLTFPLPTTRYRDISYGVGSDGAFFNGYDGPMFSLQWTEHYYWHQTRAYHFRTDVIQTNSAYWPDFYDRSGAARARDPEATGWTEYQAGAVAVMDFNSTVAKATVLVGGLDGVQPGRDDVTIGSVIYTGADKRWEGKTSTLNMYVLPASAAPEYDSSGNPMPIDPNAANPSTFTRSLGEIHDLSVYGPGQEAVASVPADAFDSRGNVMIGIAFEEDLAFQAPVARSDRSFDTQTTRYGDTDIAAYINFTGPPWRYQYNTWIKGASPTAEQIVPASPGAGSLIESPWSPEDYATGWDQYADPSTADWFPGYNDGTDPDRPPGGDMYVVTPVPPAYTYLSFDLSTNTQLGEVQFQDVSYGYKLSAAGSGSFSIPVTPDMLKQQVKQSTTPGRTGIYVMRDHEIVWGGIIWKRQYDSGSRACRFEAQTFESYFNHRFQNTVLGFENVDQMEIARTLALQAADEMHIDVDPATSGVMRYYTSFYYEFKTLGSELDSLASLWDGFDWNVRVYVDENGVLRRRLVWGYPFLGISKDTTQIAFEYPGTIRTYTVTEDADKAGNRLWAIGGGQGLDQIQYEARDQNQLDNGWPLLETSTSYKDVFIPAQLQDRSKQDLQRLRPPVTSLNVEVSPFAEPKLGSYNPGDWARFVIADDWNTPPVDTKMRITGYTVARTVTSPLDRVTLEIDAGGSQ